uniref:Argininosuccinate synthase n=1 Tax=Lygus hesperus TaxID=30085 RepID=A0A0A9WX24_LYGHE
MAEKRMTVVAQSSRQNKKEIGFEKFVRMYAPHIGIYNAWRDSRLMEDFTSEADQIAYLRSYGIKDVVKNNGEVHNSVCGITHYCKDVHDLPLPTYVKALRDCSETGEFVSLTYRHGRCVNVNGVDATPLIALQMANDIAGRNGVGVTRTREGAMYEAPGMELLTTGLRFLYEMSFDRTAADLFRTYSSHVAQQLALGQYA